MPNDERKFRPLNKEEIEALQKENPEMVIGTISEKDLDRYEKVLKEEKEIEAEFPIMRNTDDSLDLFQKQMDFESEKRQFIYRLEYTPIQAAIQQWLKNLNKETARNYAYYITDMIRRGIIPERDASGNIFTVGHLNHVNHEATIDYIKRVEDWAEGTRQVRAACYISLTAFLNRISYGWFRKAEPSTLAQNPTFFQTRDKVSTEALSLHQCHVFLEALGSINKRDALIAKTLLQGAKRLTEVLDLKTNQVDFEKNMIRFIQKKTGGMIKEIPITYPKHFMDELQEYINNTKDHREDSPYVFITRKGKKLTRSRLNYSFEEASKQARLWKYDEEKKEWKGTKVTPHMMRATWVTEAKRNGIADTEIMKVTGHTTSKMIYAYDKTSAEDNYSKKMVLI